MLQPQLNSQTIIDKRSRPIHDLRISVIDRCNFRCTYCMPEKEFAKHYTFLPKHNWLSFDEIITLARIFVGLGVEKIRITGGEPLLRPNIDQLIYRLKNETGISDLALTTNGVLLVEHAHLLKQAGLDRLTVSLDSLDEDVCRTMNGGRASVQEILDGITEAERAGFRNMKINTVIEKGVNNHTILDLVKYFRGSGHIVRFIEYMDVGNCNHWQLDKVVPSKVLYDQINARFPLEPLEPNYTGEVARRYKYKDGSGEIGFISSVSQAFCGDCTRARLSTDGKLFTCLFSDQGHDLRQILRNHYSAETAVKTTLQQIWSNRTDRYSEDRAKILSKHPTRHKVEMFQIGG